jgi:hypothetical protein
MALINKILPINYAVLALFAVLICYFSYSYKYYKQKTQNIIFLCKNICNLSKIYAILKIVSQKIKNIFYKTQKTLAFFANLLYTNLVSK